jgi:hypothetical protein
VFFQPRRKYRLNLEHWISDAVHSICTVDGYN